MACRALAGRVGLSLAGPGRSALPTPRSPSLSLRRAAPPAWVRAAAGATEGAKGPITSPDIEMSRGDGEAVRRVLLSRRTVNSFTTDPVPEEIVMDAVESARWAPNHRITEPWRFYLLGPETAGKVASINSDLILLSGGSAAKAKTKYERWCEVPGWLLVTARRSPGDELKEQEDYAATCAAVQNLTLSLWGRGVGTKWTTGAVTRSEELAELVGCDWEAERSVGMVWYGWPAAGEPTPSRRRLGAEDLVTRLP